MQKLNYNNEWSYSFRSWILKTLVSCVFMAVRHLRCHRSTCDAWISMHFLNKWLRSFHFGFLIIYSIQIVLLYPCHDFVLSSFLCYYCLAIFVMQGQVVVLHVRSMVYLILWLSFPVLMTFIFSIEFARFIYGLLVCVMNLSYNGNMLSRFGAGWVLW